MAARTTLNRLPDNGRSIPMAEVTGPKRCALLRDLGGRGEGWRYQLEADDVRPMLRMEDPTVATLREVADAFGMAAQSVKGDWRDNGMPGSAGCWDLAEVLAWRINADAKAKGRHLPRAVDVLDDELGKLAERFGITSVIEAAERLSAEWDATLAECEAVEAARAKETKHTSRRRRMT